MTAPAAHRWPVLALLVVGSAAGAGWLGLPQPIVASLSLALLLGWAAWVDLRDFIIPNAASLAIALSGLGVTLIVEPGHVGAHGLSALIAGGGFWALSELWLRLRGRDGLGLGDAKLIGAGALWVGPEVSWAILVGAGTALLYGLMGAANDRSALDRPLPFGPFLALGLWWAWLLHGAA